MNEKGQVVIIGLGKTGMSCARYFASIGKDFCVHDDNPLESSLQELNKISPNAFKGPLKGASLSNASRLVVSPGVSINKKEIKQAADSGVPVTGDVEIFSHSVDKPLAVITGSNGKSTVTSLVAHLLKQSGKKVGVGGNIGTPCLDLLNADVDCYVLEVSSFQMDTTHSLPCQVATVLNLSADHMDRYATVEEYFSSKARIYEHCDQAVLNRDINYEFHPAGESQRTFGVALPANDEEYGLLEEDGLWLMRGKSRLLDTGQLQIKGRHNSLNALAAMAIGEAMGLKVEEMISSILSFSGLPHRCEFLGSVKGLEFYNDSKSTNPDSTRAALEGLGGEKNIILMLGGQSKSADFSQLNPVVEKYVKHILTYGEDARLIEDAISMQAKRCLDIDDLVSTAVDLGRKGVRVLFSPGCASFDMFSGYEERGDVFRAAVRRIL